MKVLCNKSILLISDMIAQQQYNAYILQEKSITIDVLPFIKADRMYCKKKPLVIDVICLHHFSVTTQKHNKVVYCGS